MTRVPLLFVAAVLSCSVASADYISSLSYVPGSSGVTLLSSSISPLPVAAGPNVVNLNFDVTKMPVGGWTVNFGTTKFADGNAGRDYLFNVTLHNDLLFNKEIGGLLVTASSAGYASHLGSGNDINQDLAAGPFHYALNPETNDQATGIYFGGLAGGGGSIPQGQDETFTFDYHLPSSTGATNRTFSMTFTANPEPGSLALAGLLGIPGLLCTRRRRQEVTAESVSDV